MLVVDAQFIVRELGGLERPLLEAHFLALEAEDRRLRFGLPLGDHALRAYVARIDFERDAAFGILDDDLALIGAAHVARDRGQAELGVSVLQGHRGHGYGGALLARALQRARNWGVGSLFMHCLAENGAMMHLARKQGMNIVAASGEADAWLKLPPADASSHFGEVFAQRVALFDHALKAQAVAARRLAGALRPGTGSPDREK
jgi:GNAT superfamily N-acetyltransferase